MGMLDLETLARELGIEGKAERNNLKRELIKQIIDYFGKEDARLVLSIALYFKYPATYQNIGAETLKYLREARDEMEN